MLYEVITLGPRRHHPQDVAADDPVGRVGIDTAEFSMAGRAVLDAVGMGQRFTTRITSYNVCYTKLLRLARRWRAKVIRARLNPELAPLLARAKRNNFV